MNRVYSKKDNEPEQEQIIRTWKRDRTTNTMGIENALDNLECSSLVKLDRDQLRIRLKLGETIHTEWAAFCLEGTLPDLSELLG